MNTENTSGEITFQEIFAFLKKNSAKIFIRGILTFVFTIIIILLLYAFIPRDASSYRDILLTLQEADKTVIYPSENPFSASDIISPLILRKVYDNNKLQDRISFQDFSALFSLTKSASETAKLEAEYNTKMSQKNITVPQLQALEREYKKRQKEISTNDIRIAMASAAGLTNTEVAKILNEIPETWFNIYSKLEAAKFPQIEASKTLKDLREQVSSDTGHLVMMEKTRVYCLQLIRMCQTLSEMQHGKNIVLPSGEILADIQNQLENIEKYQINMYHQYFLTAPQYQGIFDKVFIVGNIQKIERDLIRVNAKYDNVLKALEMLQSKIEKTTSPQTAQSTAKSSDFSLQLDNTFFNQFADMVRNDVNNELRANYTQKAIEYGDERAELEADKAYFESMISPSSDTTSSIKIDPKEFVTQLRQMYTDLFIVAEKVILFRDMITTDYLTSRSFYVPLGDVQIQKEFRLPFARIALGLFALFLLYNLLTLTKDFYRFCENTQKK